MVRCRVIRDQDVAAPVVIDVGRDHSEAIVGSLGEQTCLYCDIREGAIPVVVIKNVNRARQTMGAAHHREASELAGLVRIALAGDLSGIKRHIVGGENIEDAVSVIVQKRRAREL